MIAVVFPGQGSQKPGMGKELAGAFAVAKETYEMVSEATGIDIAQLSWQEDEELLRQTQNAQIALFTVSLAAYRVFASESQIPISAFAGHSVGEFTALVASEIYAPEIGARLVKTRGLTMAAAGEENPGAMAAVLGLDTEILTGICRNTPGIVAVANDNSPGQVVISGQLESVSEAGAAALKAGAKRVIALNVSGAFHSPLMEGPSKRLRFELDQFVARDPVVSIYSNVTSESEKAGRDWPDLLERQLISPVRWTETVQHLVRDGIGVTIECGVGDVLSGLNKRIDKSITSLKVNDIQSLKDSIAALTNDAPAT